MFNVFGKKPTVEGTVERLCRFVCMYLAALQVNRYVYLKLVLYMWWHRFTEQQRGTERVLRKVGRDIERDRRGLEKEEKKLVSVK